MIASFHPSEEENESKKVVNEAGQPHGTVSTQC
jgi:hypothetical protein